MFDARRPMGRLFYALLLVIMAGAMAWAQAPATTTINDVVYRGDGTVAGGTLLTSWPAFTSADGYAVAAGSTSVTLGSGGALSVALVPNASATPSGTVYTVVYQLDDGTVKTEYWVVPAASPTNLTAVRTALGTAGTPAEFASQQYVNAAVATKANDAAVVHLSGSETVSGAKDFAVSPSVPTPAQPADAVNKAYVDAAVTTVGSGSYVSKAGDTMTGPLTLAGDPTAPSQAATRNYVDTGLAAKADLTAGKVPTAELGSGTSGTGTCLQGDQTWGPCGSSSNAVEIQSVPVDATAPGDNQVLTYVASAGKYEAKPGGGVTAGMQAVKYATDFGWSQTPSDDLSTPGVKTVNLTACPPGVREAVQVTGGTCNGDGLAGTLQFVTENAHATGYTVGSASGGLQESLIAARYAPTNPTGTPQSGKVIVPPGEIRLYARVSIRSTNMTVDFSGSIVECYMADTCIFVGDPSNANAYNGVTLINPRGRPMVVGGTFPFIEVNAQKTRIFNLSSRSSATGAYFGSYVQVDGDQSFLLDGLDTTQGGYSTLRCDATVCSPAIYAPGPFSTNPALGYLKNMNLSLQCAGNGVDWQAGNSLRISDSVIQGYAQYGIRGGVRRGGFGGFQIDNLYQEVGNCANPAGNIGEAGVIMQGQALRLRGGEGPAGKVPQFANTGTTDYRYYVVAHHATYGPANPLYAGQALTNGSGNITVTTPDIAGASTLDLLRVTAVSGTHEQAPYGTGNYAVVAGVSRASACANGVCTFTDTQAALQSYTVATPTYFPELDFWPGSIVLGASGDSNLVSAPSLAYLDDVPSDIVSIAGTSGPSVMASRCAGVSQWSPLWMTCLAAAPPSQMYSQSALVMVTKPSQDAGQSTNLKGRLNMGTVGTGPGHIITLSDSNFQKTIATANNRPSNDVSDAYIGYDHGTGNPAQVGISLGAPLSISSYIGNVGDGTNWLERLTANLKEFKTNVQVDGNLTVSGGISGSISTASALATTPTQCSGSFATGIQANGNANCSTADVIQLAETADPPGVPNYGIFWFDQTCHCPKVISNNGQEVQLGLTNVFNSDANGTNSANVLEEKNGTSPQELRVYGTYTDNSDYERARLGYDATDGYYFLGADAAGSGLQRGLGFWMQGSLRWAMDTGFNFKPWSDNNRDIGSAALRPKRVYAGTYVDATTGAMVTDIANEGTTGTAVNKLAKLTGAPSTAIVAATSDTGGVAGVVVDGAGTANSAQVARSGQANCIFDGATTAGDYVQISSTAAGDCHDAGASYPSSGQVLGRVLSTNGSGGTYAMLVGGETQGGTLTAPNNTSDPWMTVAHLSTSATVFSSSANKAALFGVILQAPKTTTQVTYDVGTADNTAATYDLGIYSGTSGGTCTLVAHTGPIAGSTAMNPTGWHTVNWTGGSVTLNPGRYYLAITSSSTSATAILAGDSAGFTFAGGAGAGSVGNASVTSGGTLPATVSCPTDSYGLAVIPGFAVN
jgi:hypothetical protein